MQSCESPRLTTERKSGSCARRCPALERKSGSCEKAVPHKSSFFFPEGPPLSHNSGFSFPPSTPAAHNSGFFFPAGEHIPHNSGFSFPGPGAVSHNSRISFPPRTPASHNFRFSFPPRSRAGQGGHKRRPRPTGDSDTRTNGTRLPRQHRRARQSSPPGSGTPVPLRQSPGEGGSSSRCPPVCALPPATLPVQWGAIIPPKERACPSQTLARR